ncbi:hypothetical protein [Nonomuraea sp. 10N515B]|uniref:hypothetical protein n=1 Tax=Nonomuraea sp. 10N515B TaxID=3457422 RepID=UPI003FCCDFEF
MTESQSVIDPDALIGYMASRGWRYTGTWQGAMVWQLESSGRILIPAQREAGDEYVDDEELLATALRKLAKFEDRPEHEVLLDIAEPAVDTPSFKLEPDAPSGTIPLPAALRAVQGIHDLLRIAAQTTESGPRLLYTGQRSREVDTFLQRVRLGTSRPGSYIFDARVPVSQPPQRSMAISWNDGLAGRDVMTTLHKALHAAHSAAALAAEDSEHVAAFGDHVEDGVSANLCTTLSDIGGNRPFTISFAWAWADPINLSPVPLAFTSLMTRVLAAAGKELERLARTGQVTVTGEVETLHDAPGEVPRVKIRGDFQGGSDVVRRSIWVALNAHDYQRAFHAQVQGRLIRVIGHLDPNERRLTLRPDPGGFEII